MRMAKRTKRPQPRNERLVRIAATIRMAASARRIPRPRVNRIRVQRRRPGGSPLVVSGADADSDRKSTRLNSSHTVISYAVFCLKKNKQLALQVPDEAFNELNNNRLADDDAA